MVKTGIDFCCCCGDWIPASTGTMREGPEDEAEIVCDSCLALEQARAEPVKHDHKSGMLKDLTSFRDETKLGV